MCRWKDFTGQKWNRLYLFVHGTQNAANIITEKHTEAWKSPNVNFFTKFNKTYRCLKIEEETKEKRKWSKHFTKEY